MAELEGITEALRRQRKDLDDIAESTSTRTTETAALLEKIEELRVRAEKTQRVFDQPKTIELSDKR
jgi:phosphohistidine phosphatase SixA